MHTCGYGNTPQAKNGEKKNVDLHTELGLRRKVYERFTMLFLLLLELFPCVLFCVYMIAFYDAKESNNMLLMWFFITRKKVLFQPIWFYLLSKSLKIFFIF